MILKFNKQYLHCNLRLWDLFSLTHLWLELLITKLFPGDNHDVIFNTNHLYIQRCGTGHTHTHTIAHTRAHALAHRFSITNLYTFSLYCLNKFLVGLPDRGPGLSNLQGSKRAAFSPTTVLTRYHFQHYNWRCHITEGEKYFILIIISINTVVNHKKYCRIYLR